MENTDFDIITTAYSHVSNHTSYWSSHELLWHCYPWAHTLLSKHYQNCYMLNSVIASQSVGSTNMSCGSLGVEQSLPQPSPGQCLISIMITILLWYAALVGLLILPLRFITFNHISILQHALERVE